MKPAGISSFVSRSVSIALFLCMAACATVRATTYYVSPAGNDGNTGTSQAAPWKTLSKINNTSLLPGDTVLFQRGGTWRESLTVKTSGAAGNPITFGDYGTGNKPTFYGSDILTNANFTSTGNNNYNYNLPGLSGLVGPAGVYVLVNNQFLGTGPQTYNDPTLTINSPTDPRSDGKLYTVCVRGNTVFNQYQSHLVFSNLVADETTMWMDGNGQGYGFRIQGSTDVLLESCEGLHCGRHNIAVIDADQVTMRKCHVAYPAPNYNGGNSLYVSYADAGMQAASSLSIYDRCTADNQGGYDFYDGHSQDGKPLHVVFLNCTSSEAMVFCTSDIGGSYAFTNCTLLGGRIELFTPNSIVDGVLFKNNAMIDVFNNCQSNTIQNCVWQNVSPAEVACILMRSGAHNNTVRFCTVKAASGACMGFYSDTSGGGDGHQTGLKFYGNIFAGTPTSAGYASDDSYADYNFYDPAPGTVMGQNWATWTGGGHDTHSKTGDPLFVNPAGGDYTLQAGSPAINAATGVPALPATDFVGTTRPQGSAADMGAYEYGSAPAAPVITSATTAGGITGQSFSYQITASGSPTNYNATGLPSGLSINRSSGLISGTPTVAGTSSVTLSATGAGGTGTATLTLTITAPGVPVITSPTTASATINQSFSYQITASGSPTNYNATGLPSGLSINRASGLISGTPTVAGTNSVTLSATGAGGTGTATLTITVTATPPGPSGLIGWWKLDESSGTTAVDSSGNGNNGTLNGAPVWQPAGGKLAGALNFNSGDYVDCGAGASLSTPSVTLAFWMKPSQMAVMGPVDKLPMSTGAGYAVRLRNTGDIWFRLGSEPGTQYDVYGPANSYTNGVWTHVAGTFDSASGTAKLYVNGVQAAQATYAITLSTAGTHLLFAKENKTANEAYAGLLDDVRIYDHALTSNEIVTVMAGGTGGSSNVPPPVISSIGRNPNQAGMIELSWLSASGAEYSVYKTTNLLAVWPAQPLTNNVGGDGTIKLFSEPMGTLRAAFYRLKAVGN